MSTRNDKNVIGEADGGNTFWCEGCVMPHLLDSRWEFNGDRVKPTFTPSILNTYRHPEGYNSQHPAPVGFDGEYVEDRCHSYITDGNIEYLSDSTHSMAGLTVELKKVSY